jgi:hypothetical protein
MQTVLLALFYCSWVVSGFLPRSTGVNGSSGTTIKSSTVVGMAKKMRNSQAELAKKMALAREQKAQEEGADLQVPEAAERLSSREIKERNDRLRFEELLQTQSTSFNDVSSDGYLNARQEEAEIDAYRK